MSPPRESHSEDWDEGPDGGAAFDQAPIGLAHIALDGTWRRVNPRLGALLGYAPAELRGRRVHDLTHPDDLAETEDFARRARAGQVREAVREKRYVRRDGAAFWALVTTTLVHDDAGRPDYFFTAIEDIDARKRAQAELAEAQRLLTRRAALLDLSRDAIVVHEAQTNRITFWSRGAEALYGWTREEALGRVAHALLRTEFPLPHADILAAMARTGGWEGDLVHTRRDGERLVVSSRWAPAADGAEVLEVNRDVTAERRREAERAADLAHQARIAETLQHSLLMAPPPDIFPGLTVKATYQGAREDVLVGGDFFDICAVGENRIALVVGDVTGKGLEAAAYTAEVKFALRVILRESPDPAEALTRLNRFVVDAERYRLSHQAQPYVPLALAVLDTATGAVETALAGMERPLLLRTDTGEATAFTVSGPLLGVDLEARFESQRETMAEGDLLVMTTDGLVEARHPARRRDFFGDARLEQAVREEAARTESLAEAGLSVVARVRAFAGGALHDDACLLLARRTPHPA